MSHELSQIPMKKGFHDGILFLDLCIFRADHIVVF